MAVPVGIGAIGDGAAGVFPYLRGERSRLAFHGSFDRIARSTCAPGASKPRNFLACQRACGARCGKKEFPSFYKRFDCIHGLPPFRLPVVLAPLS
jgi:hypothetical protein